MAEPPAARPHRVLFLCGQDAIRSPMAAALTRHLFGSSVEVGEAGVVKGEADPFVVPVMDEIGIDLSRHRPRTLEDLEEDDGLDYDLVISLSPEAHHRALELTRTRSVKVEYWPTADPTGEAGNREQRLAAYRQVREDLMRRIKQRFAAAQPPSG